MTMNQNDHDQIIDQVISLEDDFSDASSAMVTNVAVSSVENDNMRVITSDPIVTIAAATTTTQHQHHMGLGDPNHSIPREQHPHETNIHHEPCVMPIDSDSNDRQQLQLSSSSEDLLNLLLEFDRDSSTLISGDHPLDQDEKTGIETIRKQLMSCEVQSEQIQHQHNDSMSPIGVNPMACLPQQPQHHQQHTQQLISQTAPIIPNHQQQHHPSLTNPTLSEQHQRQQMPQHHQRLSVDQSLLNGPYSGTPVNFVPVSTSSQAYMPQQQQHQNVSRTNQTNNPISTVNNSPSPSWQQNQQSISPFSPQQNHHQQQQHQPHKPQQQRQNHPNATTSSPQLHQQLQQHHHPLQQQRSPSQSVSPPVTANTATINVATSEPSPVVKKNPLLNAQLVNSRAPSLTPTRFLGNQTNFLNQNPILNSKLSQSPFVTTNSPGAITSPVNPSLNPQPNRFMPQQQQQVASTFGYDVTTQQQQQQQQQQQHPAHHTTSQTTGQINLYGQSGDQQQGQLQATTNNPLYRPTSAASMRDNTTSPSGGNLNQQVKQEIRRKVQHQTTSLLKQLLSDDNK